MEKQNCGEKNHTTVIFLLPHGFILRRKKYLSTVSFNFEICDIGMNSI